MHREGLKTWKNSGKHKQIKPGRACDIHEISVARESGMCEPREEVCSKKTAAAGY